MIKKKKRIYNKSTGRNYARDTVYQSSAIQRAKRVKRTLARRAAIKKGIVKKGDGMDIDHIDRNPLNDSPSNLRAIPQSVNRGYARSKAVSDSKEYLRRLRAR